MISQERAKEILSNSKLGSLKYTFNGKFKNIIDHEKGITEYEDAYINEMWRFLPGFFSYTDVLRTIAQDKLISHYHWYSFKKDESGQWKITDSGKSSKDPKELYEEAQLKGLVVIEDSRSYLRELVSIWNRTQSKESPILWIYSISEIDAEDARSMLIECNQLG